MEASATVGREGALKRHTGNGGSAVVKFRWAAIQTTSPKRTGSANSS